MIVVVEGPDNAGKTTLALYLAKAMQAVFIKAERPPQGISLQTYMGILSRATEYSGHVVTDRHVAISEPIYGPICRGRHELPSFDIERSLRMVDRVIYCRPGRDAILGSLRARPQMEGVIQNAEAIIEAYDAYFSRITGPSMVYSYLDTPDPKCVLDWVRRDY